MSFINSEEFDKENVKPGNRIFTPRAAAGLSVLGDISNTLLSQKSRSNQRKTRPKPSRDTSLVSNASAREVVKDAIAIAAANTPVKHDEEETISNVSLSVYHL